MIKAEFIFPILLSACCSFSLQAQGQNTWSKTDSLKLKQLLDGETDLFIDPIAKQEIDLLFSTSKQIRNTPILPIEDLLPQPQKLLKKYPMPKFRLDNTRIYHTIPRLTNYFLNSRRFSILASTEYKSLKVLLEQKSELMLDITPKLGFHLYGGYSRSGSKSPILPDAVTPAYVGTGFSYRINERIEISTGLDRQFNIIKKQWEWVWKTGVKATF